MLGGCLILGSCLALGGCLMLLGACSSSSLVSPRERSGFNADWRFHLGDGLQAAQPGFADNDWRVLDLPHDWAIEGDFSQEEVEKAIACGFRPISLGKSRLRTETAALAACHILNITNQIE
mgnify:CR=1 FL=1